MPYFRWCDTPGLGQFVRNLLSTALKNNILTPLSIPITSHHRLKHGIGDLDTILRSRGPWEGVQIFIAILFAIAHYDAKMWKLGHARASARSPRCLLPRCPHAPRASCSLDTVNLPKSYEAA